MLLYSLATHAMGLDESLPPGNEQQDEQQHGQHDAHRQGIDHAFGVALVLDQVKQTITQAGDDAQQAENDEKLDHSELRRAMITPAMDECKGVETLNQPVEAGSIS